MAAARRGLACADILNKKGHTVVLYERDNAVGGYLRYGIPDFKLDKKVIDRRVNLLVEEGLIIKTGVNIGEDISFEELREEFDAICLTIGARHPRDLPVSGRDADGIHFAMDFLKQQNKVVRGEQIPPDDRISAKDKHVVVIGGGDTGADCVGTSNRQGAKSVTQLEILPEPPMTRPPHQPWPVWPTVYRMSHLPQGGLHAQIQCFHQSIRDRQRSGHGSAMRRSRVGAEQWSLCNARNRRNGIQAGS